MHFLFYSSPAKAYKSYAQVNCWLPIYAIILLFISSSYCAAQKTKKNQFEIFVPICHFFDGSNTNWGLLVDEKNRNGEIIGKELPATVGLQYSRAININHGIRLSAYHYGINYTRPNNAFAVGEVNQRMYTMFIAGYSYRLLSYSSLDILVLADLNYRTGHERITVVPFNFHSGMASAIHNDLGLSLGTRLQQHLVWGFLLSLEAKYTRMLYLYDSYADYYNLNQKPTTNILTFQLGLGYRF